MKHPIGHSSNGVAVHVDLIHSRAAKNIAKQPHLLGLVAEVLPKTTLQGSDMQVEHDMGRVIGYNFVVQTSDTDSVFYAQLLRENTYTRFIKSGEPLSTQYLTLVFRHSEEDEGYELFDAWIGRLNPPQPGTADETPESKPYWSNHALILGDQSLQLRTVTKVCPY